MGDTSLLIPEKLFKIPDKRVVYPVSADRRTDAAAHIRFPGNRPVLPAGADMVSAMSDIIPERISEIGLKTLKSPEIPGLLGKVP